ncbi:MAG: MmcQ/YjbR family DNA-binding protein [Streptosporangiaceae bacterium]
MMTSDEVREIASGLAGVEERETWGKPTFRVAGKMFLTLASDGSQATLKASHDDQAALIAAEPTVFFPAAYVGRHGWVTVSLERADRDEVAALVVEAWRARAPRHLSEGQERPPVKCLCPSGTCVRARLSAEVSAAVCERSR